MKNFSPRSPRHQFSTVATDVHYQLCNTYMKQTGDQLANKELQLMMETNQFLDNFG